MRSTFFGLSSALSGIMTNQRALDTTNHNIANVNNPAFSRQRVNVEAALPYSNPAWNTSVIKGQLGTGVNITDLSRMRDQFIDLQFRSETSGFGEQDARATALQRLDKIVGEPGELGLSEQFGRFWSSWQTLSTNAGSAPVRESVRAAGASLAQQIQDVHTQLLSSQDEATTRIGAEVANVNLWAEKISDLNVQIFKVQALGHTPNDLMDQRDALIDNIARAGDLTVSTAANGKVSLAFGGQVLVDGTSDTVNAVAVDGAGTVTVGGNVATLESGSLRGLIDIRDVVIGGPGGYLEQLDHMAVALINETNARHQAGVGLDGSTGNDFFSGTGAADIAISGAVLASTDAIAAASNADDLPGGADNAVNITQLRFTALTVGSVTTTIDGAWSAWVAKLGVDTDQATRLRDLSKGVLDVATARRDAISGVNIDEEISDMVRFQKSYNAAARMVTTIDSMLETIVTRMGLVGR